MPNQGDSAQEKGKTIATAFEKGVADPNHDMRPAIQALQDAARGNPQEYQRTLAVAINCSITARIQTFASFSATWI